MQKHTLEICATIKKQLSILASFDYVDRNMIYNNIIHLTNIDVCFVFPKNDQNINTD